MQTMVCLFLIGVLWMDQHITTESSTNYNTSNTTKLMTTSFTTGYVYETLIKKDQSAPRNEYVQITNGSGYYHNIRVYTCEDVAGVITTTVTVCEDNDKDTKMDCVSKTVIELLEQSKNLTNGTVQVFLDTLKNTTIDSRERITSSPLAISTIVETLTNVHSFLSKPINEESTQKILEIAGILTSDDAKESWSNLNNKNESSDTNNGPKIKSSSSSFLNLFELISTALVNKSLTIKTPFILLKKTDFTNNFTYESNASVKLDIQTFDIQKKFVTIIIFTSMDNVLPTKDNTKSSFVINGKVALVKLNAEIRNLSVKFDMLKDNLKNPKCVFWDFKLFNGLGGWSDWGCFLLSNEDSNKTISCSCNHTTSFSILMSSESFKDPKMDDITIIGVGISIGSLVICLITEALTWKKISTNTTSFLRHISIVNMAVSLLIANIWFIIGASDDVKKNTLACTAATFFIHFFYLAMFFWMLASGLLLLYRTVFVFEGGLSKRSMLVIGFSLGYVAPLIIAVTTVAVTAPSKKYMRGNHDCWLNWEESKSLLAFLTPVLLIVTINSIIMIVVIYKMLKRRVEKNADKAGEQHVLIVIGRSLAVLTPFFGLTWSLGIGTIIAPKNREIHLAFSLCNSLQGCFIWVFGTLLDKKVRSEAIKSLSSQEMLKTGS